MAQEPTGDPNAELQSLADSLISADDVQGLPPEALAALGDLAPAATTTTDATNGDGTTAATEAQPKPAATSGAQASTATTATATAPVKSGGDGTAATAAGDGGTASTAAPKPGDTTAPVSLHDLLATADIAELRQHPRIAAIVGDLVGKAKTDLKRTEREVELDRIAERDPDHPLAQDRNERKAQQQTEEQLEGVRTEGEGRGLVKATGVVKVFVDSLPPAEQEAYNGAIKGKTYGGEWHEGYQSYLKDLVDSVSVARVNAARAEWEQTEREAIRKEVLGERNGAEPSPRVNSGASAAAGKYRNLTPAELDAMPVDEYVAHEAEILDGLTQRKAA